MKTLNEKEKEIIRLIQRKEITDILSLLNITIWELKSAFRNQI